jgi:DNA-binding NarL/FixJ family response regulator
VEGPIVGRAHELGQLRAALVAAASGGGRLVLVSGEPGIGKTRLASAVTGIAAEYDVPVAAGYAIDDPGMPPLWPWRRLSRTIPGLATVLAGAPGSATADDSATARFGMFAAACQAIADAAADRGLLVILEDLQWSDRSSLVLLRHLAGELPHTRALVLATFRETVAGPLPELLPDLLRADGTRAVRLAGLSQQDIAQWLRRLQAGGDQQELSGRLLARTGGNPLFVRLLVERGTGGVGAGLSEFPELRQLVLGRLGGLDDRARELVDAASVLGERIDPQLLAEVTGQPAAQAGDLLDHAVRHGVLLSSPDTAGLSFAHALIRDAVYEVLAPSRRMGLHERAARALERSAGNAAAGQIAGHWRRSGSEGWASRCVRWARAAAASATAALAYDEAAQFAALALEAADADGADPCLRAELALEAARAEFAGGHIAACLGRCEAAAKLAKEAGRPDILASAALVITGMGDPATSAAVVELCTSAERAMPAGDAALRARLRARQAIFAAETDAFDRARELSAEALALASRSDDPDALLDAIHARHLSLSAPQYLAERRQLAMRAGEIAARASQPLGELWSHLWLIDVAFQEGDLAAVDRELARIEHLAVSRRLSVARWHLHRFRATRAALVGDLDTAVEQNETARAVAAQIGAFSTIGMYYTFLFHLALLRGTIEREQGEAILAMMRQAPGVPLVRAFIPLVYLLLGERDQARAAFEEFRRLPGTLQVGPRWMALLAAIGNTAVRLDDTETVDRVYREVSGLPLSYAGDGTGVVFSVGAQERVVADFALAIGRLDEAVSRYTTAIEMNARIGARPFLALSRLGLARSLVARANSADLPAARALVIEAAAEFRRLDLPGPLAIADTLLAEIDHAVRTASPLTPRESEVAALIARAMSNKQIAERLVLSERTVETHVRSILIKLGYSTRTEIATWSVRGATGAAGATSAAGAAGTAGVRGSDPAPAGLAAGERAEHDQPDGDEDKQPRAGRSRRERA